MASASDIRISYTQTGGDAGSAYGNSPDSDNTCTLYYQMLDWGSMWGSGDTLSSVTFMPETGLTYSYGVGFSSSGHASVSWYMEISCNGGKIRFPASGYRTESYPCYAGKGNAYCGFVWSYGMYIPISNSGISSGKIALLSGTIADLLAGIKANKGIKCQYYFSNSQHRILTNAQGWIYAWETNTAPSEPICDYPITSKTTYNTKPRFSMKGTDMDGNTLTYQYSMDNSTWTNLATGVSSGTSKVGQVSTAQSTGSKTLYIRTYDGLSYSTTKTIPFTIETTSISPSSETKIDDSLIDKAQSYITNLAAYYKEETPSWTIQNTENKLTAASISDLNTKLKDLPPAQSFTVPTAGTKALYSVFATDINNAIKNS